MVGYLPLQAAGGLFMYFLGKMRLGPGGGRFAAVAAMLVVMLLILPLHVSIPR
jgi:hypothetical protein